MRTGLDTNGMHDGWHLRVAQDTGAGKPAYPGAPPAKGFKESLLGAGVDPAKEGALCVGDEVVVHWLVAAEELLEAGTLPSRAEIREHLSGNYCRCTGYEAIVDVVESVARARAGKAQA